MNNAIKFHVSYDGTALALFNTKEQAEKYCLVEEIEDEMNGSQRESWEKKLREEDCASVQEWVEKNYNPSYNGCRDLFSNLFQICEIEVSSTGQLIKIDDIEVDDFMEDCFGITRENDSEEFNEAKEHLQKFYAECKN